MSADPELVGWLSAAGTLEELFFWFSRGDIKTLEGYGYRIAVYEATVFRVYRNWAIDQVSSVLVATPLIETIPLLELQVVS